VTETVAACREAVGADFVLMVDVQYAWPDADTALRTLRDWEPLDVYFIETPLPVDDLAGMARLAEESPVDIASGEWLSTRHDFADLMDHGRVHVAQPDIGRVGGITEALRVCEMAAERGRRIVPHCWKTGIGIAASAHLAAVTPHCPFIEFLPAELTDSQLRQDLVKDDLQIIDGKVAVPDQPGLGIELDMDALRRFEQN
jgi:L-alanine-DL-glutamate epimerase-like enolase superfamily enzyme